MERTFQGGGHRGDEAALRAVYARSTAAAVRACTTVNVNRVGRAFEAMRVTMGDGGGERGRLAHRARRGTQSTCHRLWRVRVRFDAPCTTDRSPRTVQQGRGARVIKKRCAYKDEGLRINTTWGESILFFFFVAQKNMEDAKTRSAISILVLIKLKEVYLVLIKFN